MTARDPQSHPEVENPTATSHGAAGYLALPKEQRRGVALCLSGGGYRASLFDLGAMRRLNELGILSQVDTFTSVSGGSIAAAQLAAHVADRLGGVWPAAGDEITEWETGVAEPLRRLARTNIRTPAALARVKPTKWLNGNAASDALAARYAAAITRRTIAALPNRPRFVFCATDLNFRTQWVVDAGLGRVGSDQAGYLSPVPEEWTVARAVAASSCFPVVFAPMEVEIDPAKLAGGAYRGPDRDGLVRKIELTDGGVYDNLGLEPVWRDHAYVFVSDGAPSYSATPDLGPVWGSLRHVVTLLEQATDVRKRWLIAGYLRQDLAGAYWGMASLPSHFEHDPGVPLYPDDLVRRVISQVRIELDAFSEPEIAVLENHGYLLAELAVQRHTRALVRRPEARPVVPFPDWMDAQKVARAMADSHKHKLLGRGRWW